MAKELKFNLVVNTTTAENDISGVSDSLDEILEKSKIDLLIENSEAVKSVGELKKAYKELQNAQLEYGEGTEEFVKAAQAAGDLRGRLNAVNETVAAFNESPIENLSNSFTHLRSKVMALDIDGSKQAFAAFGANLKGVASSVLGLGKGFNVAKLAARGFGVALAATGIGLIVVAVGTLLSSFDSLKDSGGAIGKIFTAIGDAVTFVKDAVLDLLDSWGLIDKAATKSAKVQIEAAEAVDKKLRDLRNGQIVDDRKREILEAVGRRDDLLGEETNAELRKEIINKTKFDISKINEKYDKIEKDRIDKSADDFKKAEQDKLNTKIKTVQDAGAIDKEDQDERDAYNEQFYKREKSIKDKADAEDKARRDKSNSDILSSVDAIIAKTEKEIAKIRALEIQNEITRNKQISQAYHTANTIAMIYGSEGPMGMAVTQFGAILADSTVMMFETFTSTTATMGEKIGASLEVVGGMVASIGAMLAASSDERIAGIQEEESSKIASLERQFKAGVITESQLAAGKEKIQTKARAQELKEKKKAFEQEKAIQITQAVIGTAQGIVSASANAFPLNIAMMALAAAVGAAQIGIIASQKFPSGGGGGGGVSTPSVPSLPSVSSTTGGGGPNINFTGSTPTSINTVGGGSPQQQPFIIQSNVSISESEISGTQQTVSMYESTSSLGGG